MIFVALPIGRQRTCKPSDFSRRRPESAAICMLSLHIPILLEPLIEDQQIQFG